MLELFDTRKALEETRKELSVALYQNDAAVRVIARVSMERDVARKELQDRFAEASSGEKKRKLNDGNASAVDVVPPEADHGSKDVQMEESEGGEIDDGAKIPKATAEALQNKWKELFKARKAQKKEAVDSDYATLEQLQSFDLTQKKNYHKTSCKGMLALVSGGETIVSAGRDKQIIAYNVDTNKVSCSATTKIQIQGSTLAACVSDETMGMVTCAFAKGIVNIYTNEMQDCVTLDLELEGGDSIVGLAIHPTQRHLIVACSSGSMYLVENAEENEWKIVAKFQGLVENQEDVKCTCIGLHPDGLILGIGCSNGSVGVWDLKTEKLASTLKGSTPSSISCLHFSEKGYHVATGMEDGSVSVWDLRKQKIIATPSAPNDDYGIATICFCPVGKYLAYGTSTGEVFITVVKGWDTKILLSDEKKRGKAGAVSGVVWGKGALSVYAAYANERMVKFWGVPS